MNGELTINVNELHMILAKHFDCEDASVQAIKIYEKNSNTGKRNIRNIPIQPGDMLNIKFTLRG